MSTHDDPVRTALAARIGDDEAERLLTRILGYSNLPNLVKGVAKMPGAPATEAAALAVVEDDALADALGRTPLRPGGSPDPTEYFWGLLTLAARADLGAVDRLADAYPDRDFARKLVASIRRAATKYAATGAATGATQALDEPSGPAVPQKVSEVKRWLAAHPDVDPGLLAPRPGQKAAARAAAIRALAAIGGTRALEVLGAYAEDSYPDAVLNELHKAWERFDRRAFAATMFRQASYTLDLGVAATIDGIAAVPGLTSLDVILTGGADLAPLAEASELRTLRVGAEGTPGLMSVEPLRDLPELTELHLTRTTRNADLTPLGDLAVRRLRIDLDGADGSFLLRMQHLERVLIAAGDPPGDAQALSELVLALARKGVQVVVYGHERSWVSTLQERAEAASDVVVVERSGYLGLTDDASKADEIGRRLFSNLVP